uniref:RNA pseudouridine synthase D3 n=1 Tax=Chelonoidis abingdonii TaxID=106734 RepID=A0A8C0GDK9_CHEAB
LGPAPPEWSRARAKWRRGSCSAPGGDLGPGEGEGLCRGLGVSGWLCMLMAPSLCPPPVPGSPGQLSLVSLLPDLSQRLNLPPELHVVKAAGKDGSGLVLLSGCPGTTQQLHAFFTQLRRAGRPPATYRAVTAGVPAAMEGEIRTGLKLEQVGDLQLVVPVAAPSRHSVERKEVKQTLTCYKVLGTAPGCGLVQLQPMTGGEWAPCSALPDNPAQWGPR